MPTPSTKEIYFLFFLFLFKSYAKNIGIPLKKPKCGNIINHLNGSKYMNFFFLHSSSNIAIVFYAVGMLIAHTICS